MRVVTRSCSSDIRTDLPRYRVYQRGALVDEPVDIQHVWRDDLVAFYIGCSFTFEASLTAAGVPVRNVEQGRFVACLCAFWMLRAQILFSQDMYAMHY